MSARGAAGHGRDGAGPLPRSDEDRTDIFARAGVETRRIPFFLWMYPKRCVRFSLAALRHKKAVCVPNFGYRFLVLRLRLLPRWLVRRYVRSRFGRFDKLRLKRPPSLAEQQED